MIEGVFLEYFLFRIIILFLCNRTTTAIYYLYKFYLYAPESNKSVEYINQLTLKV